MLTHDVAATIKAMRARGDRQEDIAHALGLNQGRVAEVCVGHKFADVKPAPAHTLPKLNEPKKPRFVNPKAPIDQQRAQLDSLVRDPPQNSRTVTFTPELANWILSELNSRNRAPRSGKIRRFAEAMEKGWGLTGDTIKFGKSGLLLDGQHRLAGSFRAGVPFTTHVVFGIDDELFAVFDQGTVRTGHDAFKIAGIPYPDVSAQATRWLIIAQSGNPQDRGRTFANQELYDYYRSNVDEAAFGRAVQSALSVPKRIIPHGTLVAHLYLFEKKSSKATKAFADDLAQQARGGRTLIKKISKLREQNIGRIHENQMNALIIQTWNAYRKGVALTASMLDWTETKDYPTID